MNERRFERRPARPTANPRKVVGGIRAAAKHAGEPPWVIQRWMRLVETYAPAEQLAEGLNYARLGQARSLDIEPGLIAARVQGRMPKAYSVAVRLPVFTQAQWEPVIDAMLTQARYAATLLAGQVPPSIEDVFMPAGLHLFPAEPSEVAVSCTCPIFTGVPHQEEFRPGGPAAGEQPQGAPAVSPPEKWCKHACCVMALVADRLAADPFQVFALRGLPPADFVSRLRERRQLVTNRPAVGAAPVYEPYLSGISDRTWRPLADAGETFWAVGGGLAQVDLPIEAPEVSHPLLRRMGPSPFANAKFPIVGLLATCYDIISTTAIDAGE